MPSAPYWARQSEIPLSTCNVPQIRALHVDTVEDSRLTARRSHIDVHNLDIVTDLFLSMRMKATPIRTSQHTSGLLQVKSPIFGSYFFDVVPSKSLNKMSSMTNLDYCEVSDAKIVRPRYLPDTGCRHLDSWHNSTVTQK